MKRPSRKRVIDFEVEDIFHYNLAAPHLRKPRFEQSITLNVRWNGLDVRRREALLQRMRYTIERYM
ncbi:MAG: hypothetical protein ABIQ74_08870 [Chitinophagales bacterium]